ncbi:MAG: GNAT family N-acetyltransferase, partial [Olleya sp.]
MLIFKGEKLIAVLPANKVGDTLHSHQGLTYGGLVTHKALKFNEVLEVFKLLLQFLEDHNILYLNIKSLPSIYASGPDSQLAYLMFLL